MSVPSRSFLALAVSALVAVGTVVLALIPAGTIEGMNRYDGPWNHGLAFFALTLPLAVVWPRKVILIVAGAMAFGASIEGFQTLVGRAPELEDLTFDAVGAMIGVAIGVLASLLGKAARTSSDVDRGEEDSRRR